MSSTESTLRVARCSNVSDCALARSGETVEWYPGAGEYCPECGEVLVPNDPAQPATPEPAPAAALTPEATPPEGSSPATATAEPPPPAAGPATARNGTAGPSTKTPAAPPRPAGDTMHSAPPRRNARFLMPLRWFWIIAAAAVTSGAILYAARRDITALSMPAHVVSVCPIAGAAQLAADLLRGYAAKRPVSANSFVLTNGGKCDVRLSTVSNAPDDIIARDGLVAIVNPLNTIPSISELQLRAIYRGSIKDWSRVGGPHEPIVAMLPDAGAPESKILESSLLFGMTIGHSIRRAGSSADVTRFVTGTDRESRNAIALVAFSAAVAAKVLPLAYLPPPSVVSIASGRYPYTLAIAMQASTGRGAAAVAGLSGFARSSDGVAIVLKDGLVPAQGF